jgi:hypothetical protein
LRRAQDVTRHSPGDVLHRSSLGALRSAQQTLEHDSPLLRDELLDPPRDHLHR